MSSEQHRPDSAEFELWLDGRLDGARAREFERRLEHSPELAQEAQSARAIEDALASRFAVPPGAREAAQLATLGAPLPAGTAPARAWSRPVWIACAAGLAMTLGLWLTTSEQSDHQGPADAQALGHGAVEDCRLEEIFRRAVAGDFAPQTSCELSDSELLAHLDAPTCEGAEQLVVVGEWNDARIDAADIVMLRSGAEPVMLVVPRQEDDSGLCLPPRSGLNLFSGCWRGRRIYELSSLRESRVLNCVQAQDVESTRF